jgi:predicted tellurium resistance membrane protein TerC
MGEFSKVFFLNLISDIDNMLILGTILRRYSFLNIIIPAVIVLTIMRTIYVFLVNGISNIPMFHLLLGIILLFVAFKLVRRSIKEENLPRRSNSSAYLKVKVLLLLAASDFLICLDSIIVISGISQHMGPVTIGIFCSLLFSLLFLPLIVKLAANFFWVNIIAGGFIAQNAVIGMANDPVLADWIDYANESFPKANIVNIAANGAVIIFVLIGLFSYIKHHRISTYN